MNRKLPYPLGALGLAIVLGGTLALSLARAETPAEEEKALDFEPIPSGEDKPKVPKAVEWQTATRVKFTRKGPRAKSCHMSRVREWVKVHCDVQTTAVSLLGGSLGAAFLWLTPPKEGEAAPPAGEVIFALKPGDRRVFELFSYGPAYGGSMISPGLVLQEHWVAGEPAPTIVIR